MKTLTITLAIGLPLWIVFSWHYQFTSSGIRRAEKAAPDPEKSEKEKPLVRRILVAFAIVLLFGFAWIVQEYLGTNEEQTIILLPPNNYTGEENLDYMVDGVHDLLYGDLSKISDKLRVISPYTARAMTDAGKSISEMASEVDADYFLQLSISCVEGDNLCINPRLVSYDSGERQVWAQEYFEKKSEILNFNHFLVNKIADDINVQLSPDVERALARSTPVDTTAFDLYLRGELLMDQFTPDALAKAADYFKKAIEKDPDWGLPYAGLSLNISYQMQMGFLDPATGIPKLNEYLPIAFELNPNSSRAYLAKAISAGWAEWNWNKSETAFLESLRWDPNDPLCRGFYAHLLITLRRNDEAIRQAEIAESLDPLRPLILAQHSLVLGMGKNDFEKALSKAEKALSIDPHNFIAKYAVWGALNAMGNYEEAFKYVKEFQLPLWEKYNVTELLERTYRDEGWIAYLKEAIRINEEVWIQDGFSDPLTLGDLYFDIDNYDKAFDYYEQALDMHSLNLPYHSSSYYYNKLKDHPRYIELLKKMNLPID